MVPAAAHNLSKQNHLLSYGYDGCLQGYDNNNSSYFSEACLLGSDLMAEDESRTNSVNNNDETTGSSSKDIVQPYKFDYDHHHHEEEEEERDEGWLQLSIGGSRHRHKKFDDTTTRTTSLVELDLLNQQQVVVRPPLLAAANMTTFHVPEFRVPPPRPVPNFSTTTSLSFLQQQGHGSYSTFPPHQEINWAFRHISPQYTTPAPSSLSISSSSTFVPLGSYLARPYQLHPAAGVDHEAGPSSSLDMRVIDPPKRPHSGIWFMLQASQNQAKEPYLPQISKSYLRIKDGRMTVRLLMKYLVKKLRLDSESEIEITCRGQQLLPSLTLKHVRDNIWSSSPSDTTAITLLPDSSTTDHIMVLRYGRTP